jgi:hypothetical protein
MTPKERIQQNPVMSAASIQAAIASGINLLMAFQIIAVTEQQKIEVNAFMAIVVPMILGIVMQRTANQTPTPYEG